MSTPADKPEVVQLPVAPAIVPSARHRRAATQRVREARDRLTSTSGTRPAFDHELLRQYAQTRLSASFVVMLLLVATGVLFGFWMAPTAAAGMDVRNALHPRSHHLQLQQLSQGTIVGQQHAQMARAFHFARSPVRPVLDDDPDCIPPARIQVTNTLMMFLMLLVVAVSSMLSASLPIAALAATAPVTSAIALKFAMQRHLQ